MNGRGEDVSIALLFTVHQMCAQNVLKNSVLNRTLFITRVNCVIIMNAMTKKTLSNLKKEWLSAHQDATIEQAFDAGAFAETWLWCNRTK